ncbi:hypothetical protein [Actinomadura nitritigenes]|uniref:hypothetical protein n=1 Tax=Actinomadura nitritigenes TaxID=134602 RepID=UPI003D93A892
MSSRRDLRLRDNAQGELQALIYDVGTGSGTRKALADMAEGGDPRAVAKRHNIPVSKVWGLLEAVSVRLGIEGYAHGSIEDRRAAYNELRKLYCVASGTPLPSNEVAEDLVTKATIRSKRGYIGSIIPRSRTTAPRTVPQVIEDAAGAGFKPDPATAGSTAEMRRLLREYWEWAGEFGSRRVAAASGGAFSHATAAKLIAADSKVPLRLEYVAGMIRGCGGGDADQRAWVAAFRRVRAAARTPRLKAVGE